MKKMIRISALLALGLVLGQFAFAATPDTPPPGRSASVPISPDAPSAYTVVRGDTLWGIASKFLSQPWYWPEIWYLNPDIKNPHRIYPGDTIRLVYDANGKPHLMVERGGEVHLSPQIRSRTLDDAITAIPYDIVAAFMSKPSVIAAEDAKLMPYVVALADRRIIAGIDDVLYAKGLVRADPGTRYNIIHVGDPLKDPQTGAFLGYQGIYAGLARLERAAPGTGKDDVAKLVLTSSARETLPGDRVLSDKLEVPLDFVPHAPSKPVDGQIISVIDGVNVIGTYQVVVINRGKSHGLEPGHVLGIWERGERVPDRGPGGLVADANLSSSFTPTVNLPSEHVGAFMVFKTYGAVSYGLIMSSARTVHVGDHVKNP
jgi:LysM domain